MPYTFYDGSIVLARNALDSLTSILKVAESAPNSTDLLSKKLSDDMLPLSFQIHVVTDTAQKMANRLSGKDPLQLNRDEITSFDIAHARIKQVKDILNQADSATINSYADKTVTLGLGPGKNVEIPGAGYVSGYALPNIFFHVTTAYAILRKEGFSLGKKDYQTAFLSAYLN